jgi:hypothetical protein
MIKRKGKREKAGAAGYWLLAINSPPQVEEDKR